jgi:hypothetical protein
VLTHQILTTIGLSFDVVGAILVGVEAVKLENVRRFQQWLDLRGHQAFRLINPEITFVDEPPEHGPVVQNVLDTIPFLAWIAMGCALGGAILVGIYELVHHLGAPSIHSAPTWAIVLLSIGAFFGALLLATAVITGGEALLNLSIGGIEQLDKHTPTGGVGLVGVLFLVVGFALQVAATWVT